MKVLVTGGTGFTGSHTVIALTAAGHDVRLFVRDRRKVEQVFKPLGLVPTDVATGDMTDVAAVESALNGCDGVVHTAALVDLRRAEAGRVQRTNLRGVELVVGGAARRGLPSIVHVSSLAVFFSPGGPPLSVSAPVSSGTTAYARSKSAAEIYVRRLQDQGAPIRVSYPAGIMGPDDPGPSAVNAGLVASMRHGWLLTSSGIQVVDVRDLAALHVTLLELPSAPHRYAAAAEMFTWPAFYEMCCRVTGTRPRRITVPGALLRGAGAVGDVVTRFHDFESPLTRDRAEYMTRWPGADTARTTRELGLPYRDVEETCRDTLRWMYTAGHLSAADVGALAEGADLS